MWFAGVNAFGYGVFAVNRRPLKAHRYAYQVLVGAVPDGLVLDHEVCDMPCCVNPSHLRPKTHRANILRGRGAPAQNARKTHCPMGHALAGDNLIKSARKSRACRICHNKVANRARDMRVSA